jgi:branched-chain amino acid transport system ATP-binding protein
MIRRYRAGTVGFSKSSAVVRIDRAYSSLDFSFSVNGLIHHSSKQLHRLTSHFHSADASSTMTVRENLEVGAYTRRRDKVLIRLGLEEAFELFPVLSRKQNDLGGYLSGGERQMLAIARGLMSAPKILLLDEPSMGLSPKLTIEMFESIQRISQQERTIVILEQNAYAALTVSHFGYVLENGRVALSGDAQTLLTDDYVRQMYLGA